MLCNCQLTDSDTSVSHRDQVNTLHRFCINQYNCHICCYGYCFIVNNSSRCGGIIQLYFSLFFPDSEKNKQKIFWLPVISTRSLDTTLMNGFRIWISLRRMWNGSCIGITSLFLVVWLLLIIPWHLVVEEWHLLITWHLVV